MKQEGSQTLSPVFSHKKDRYGADQGSLKEIWLGNNEGKKAFIRQIMYDLSGKEVTDAYIGAYLNIVNRQGCGFAAAANIILQHYAQEPDQFEKDYGMPYFRNYRTVNFEELLLRFFYSQNNWHQLPITPLRFKIPQPGIRATDLAHNISWYTRQHGRQIRGRKLFAFNEILIRRLLANKRLLTMTCYYQQIKMIAPKGKYYSDYSIRFHTVVIVGYDIKKSCYIISSWGREYELQELPTMASLYVY